MLPPGSGKTYCALGGPLVEMRAEGLNFENDGLRVLYLSPAPRLLPAVKLALERPLHDLGWNFRVGVQTPGQSTQRFPHVLLTTPESLGRILTEPEWRERVKHLRAVVIDDWQALVGTKRGNLLELKLARLRRECPKLRTWAVSAPIADPVRTGEAAIGEEGCIVIQDERAESVRVQAIHPRSPEKLLRIGRSSLQRLADVLREVDPERSTLILTNTQKQAEKWRAQIQARLRDHHASLVVASPRLDLAVDLPPAEKVIQIGSVKTVARAAQRAGRTRHPAQDSAQLIVCPTNALEYVEGAALRRALVHGVIETAEAKNFPFDVLVRFTLSAACGDGFDPDELLHTIRKAPSFREITDAEFEGVLEFTRTSRFRKLVADPDGRCRFATPDLERQHRKKLRTPAKDAGLHPPALSPVLSQYVREILHEVAASGPEEWRLHESPEVQALELVFEIQRKTSAIPKKDQTLIERLSTRAGNHLVVFTWEGRAVNRAMGHLLAHRLGKLSPNLFTVRVNEHAFELIAQNELPDDDAVVQALDPNECDLQCDPTYSERVKRAFRRIARNAGLSPVSAMLLLESSDPAYPLLKQAELEVKRDEFELPRLTRALTAISEGDLVFSRPGRWTPFAISALTRSVKG